MTELKKIYRQGKKNYHENRINKFKNWIIWHQAELARLNYMDNFKVD